MAKYNFYIQYNNVHLKNIAITQGCPICGHVVRDRNEQDSEFMSQLRKEFAFFNRSRSGHKVVTNHIKFFKKEYTSLFGVGVD